MKDKFERKIYEYFEENKLPRPTTIKYIGGWGYGDCYAVTCGIFIIKKYCVYFIEDKIHSVRKR